MSTRQRQDNKIPARRKGLWGLLLDALQGRSSKNSRSRREAKEEPVGELMQIVQRVEGVVAVPTLRAREQGHYVIAEMIINVNPRITVLEGQEIAKRVKTLLMHRFIHLTDVQVYVEPYDPGYPYKSNHDPNQEQMPTLLQ